MVAYIVFTRERTRDPAELDTYSQKVSASMTGHAVTTRAFYGPQEVLEGAAVEGVVRQPRLSQGAGASIQGRRLSRSHCPRRVMPRNSMGGTRAG